MIPDFIKRPAVIVSAVFVVGGFCAYLLFVKKSVSLPEAFVVRRGTVVQEVSVTAKTKAAESVNLAFEQSGKIKRINVDVGDRVLTGQSLVELDSSELYAQLADAEANFDVQKAKLDELKRGATAEKIAVYEAKLSGAKISFENAKKNLVDKLRDTYTKSDDAVRNKADQLFKNPTTFNAQLIISPPDLNLKNDVERNRALIESNVFGFWKPYLDRLTTNSNLTEYAAAIRGYLNEIKEFLDKLSLALNNPGTSYVVDGFSQTIPSGWKTDISTARTNVNAAIANLQGAEEALNSAEFEVLLAEKNLALEKAGSTPEQIAAQEAALRQAETKVQLYQVKIYKNVLRSPINGVITKRDARVGEIVSAGIPVVSVISTGGFELEANVPEVDIAKIKIGDPAKVTLDAFGNDTVFEAKVTSISPGETIIEGVATYKVTLQFADVSESVKSGMTANVDVETARKENVIFIPRRAVISRNGEKIVRILAGRDAIREAAVETGLAGSDGNIEIVSGLNEGDRLIYGSY